MNLKVFGDPLTVKYQSQVKMFILRTTFVILVPLRKKKYQHGFCSSPLSYNPHITLWCNEYFSLWQLLFFIVIKSVVSRIHLTSILRLNGDDSLPLGTEALRGSSLNFKLVGNVLGQVWDGQTGLSTVAVHLEGTHVSWRKQQTEVRK